MTSGGIRLIAASVSVLLVGGALADAVARPATTAGPVIASVPGAGSIFRADVKRRALAVTSPAVRSQFTASEVLANVLTDLIRLDLDRRLAAGLGVVPDTRAATAGLIAGTQMFGSPAAFQQHLIRSPGAGWAGVDVYTLDVVLRRQLAVAEAARLTPVGAGELQAEYTAALGSYQHAHLQILTTPDLAVATRDAALARANPGRFASLVRADTDDETHREAGGDYGPALARGQLYASVDDAVFAATSGAVLGPIAVAQARPEYYVVRVLSVTDIPLSSVTAQLTAQALAPEGAYLQAKLTAARLGVARGVSVAEDAGTFNPRSLSVVPPASSAAAGPG